MKKKFAIILSAVVIFLFGIVVWYHVPIDLMDVDTNEVMEIVVFNGNSGNTTHITDKDIIRHIYLSDGNESRRLELIYYQLR